jgi:hypothetical protein
MKPPSPHHLSMNNAGVKDLTAAEIATLKAIGEVEDESFKIRNVPLKMI